MKNPETACLNDLYLFLRALPEGRLHINEPVADPTIFVTLPDSISGYYSEVLGHVMKRFLAEIYLDITTPLNLNITPYPLLIGAAIYNICCFSGQAQGEIEDITIETINRIPEPYTLNDAIAYHAVIDCFLEANESSVKKSVPHELIFRLIEKSPITKLSYPDKYKPVDKGLIKTILSHKGICSYIRNKLLEVKETPVNSLNMCNLFETLLKTDSHGCILFILSFYEAYCYFRDETYNDSGKDSMWPVLMEIADLLYSQDKADNERGNQMLSMFWPLLYIQNRDGKELEKFPLLKNFFTDIIQSLFELSYISRKQSGSVNKIKFR